MVFTSLFVKDPCLCYGALCYIPNWDSISDIGNDDDHIYLCDSRTFRKVPVLKGLLACAILMLICNIVFIVTYLIVSIRLRVKAKSKIQTPDVVYQQQSAAIQWGEQPSNIAYPAHQHQLSYPMQTLQTKAQWPSAPPSYDIYSEKF